MSGTGSMGEQGAASAGPPGLSNFRDFGGLPVAGRGAIVTGRFFRSAAPLALESAHIAALGRHVAVVVDLRGRVERGQASHAGFPEAGVEVRSHPVEPRTSGALFAMLQDGTASAAATKDLMIAAYRAYVTHHAADFGEALVSLVGSGRPALVHCTAGKDRTGFIVGVLQAALGADEADIVRDYLTTNTAWDRASVRGHMPLDHPAVQPVIHADGDYLAAAFEEVHARHGSARAFVREATGGRVTEAMLDALVV